MRQAILLAAPYAVIASALVEGFLHRTNELDTLGDDEPETPEQVNMSRLRRDSCISSPRLDTLGCDRPETKVQVN